MLNIQVPGFGPISAEYLVCDFTGTLSENGRLVSGVTPRLRKISAFLKVHVVTFDTFGTATRAFRGRPCVLTILSGEDGALQKAAYLESLGPEQCIAIGNGSNDTLMVKKARLGIVVVGKEGAAVTAVTAADIVVTNVIAALDLLRGPVGIKATLRN